MCADTARTGRAGGVARRPGEFTSSVTDAEVHEWRENAKRVCRAHGAEDDGIDWMDDDDIRELIVEERIQLDLLDGGNRMQPRITATPERQSDIIRVRDFSGSVPRDFGGNLRESILDLCVAQVFASTASKAINVQKRQATFVFTDPSLDSYEEIIDAGAFDASLPRYMRNPVVLPEHQHRLFGPDVAIVGHTVQLSKSGDKLLGTIYFGDWPVGDYRWRAIVAGSLRACSVGFRPVTTIRDKDGVIHYTEAILKEVSTCPIGANDNALLVNLFIAGQLETEALATPDAGRADELLAAVGELRARLDQFNVEHADLIGAGRSDDGAGVSIDAATDAALDGLVSQAEAACAAVGALAERMGKTTTARPRGRSTRSTRNRRRFGR